MRSYAALGRLLLEVFVEVANHATYGSARAALGLGAHCRVQRSEYCELNPHGSPEGTMRARRGCTSRRSTTATRRRASACASCSTGNSSQQCIRALSNLAYAREQRYTCNRAIVINVTRCLTMQRATHLTHPNASYNLAERSRAAQARCFCAALHCAAFSRRYNDKLPTLLTQVSLSHSRSLVL
jgi:hypothetical protein